MKFYSISWCDYEGMKRSQLFTNKREALKECNNLKKGEKDDWVSYVSDVKEHHVDKLTKKSVVKLFSEVG